jgi:signal transduction histidine kinase
MPRRIPSYAQLEAAPISLRPRDAQNVFGMVKFARSISNALRQLRWKLTLSYTAVTVGALLLVLLLMTILILSTIFLPYDQVSPDVWVQAVNEQVVPITRLLLSETSVNMAGLAEFVNYSDTAKLSGIDLLQLGNVTLYIRATTPLEMFIFDANGLLLGRTGYPAFKDGGQVIDSTTIPNLNTPLRAALAGETDPDQLVTAGEPGEKWVVAVPVFASGKEEGKQLGAVAYVVESMPTRQLIPSHTLALLAPSLLAFLLAAGVVGALFGSQTAKSMVRRFKYLSSVTDAWSEGDFSEFIEDPTGDEITEFGQRLNRMAEQLNELLKRRQEMAVSEERNRLARDLHDSAKQQALAASFQLGTTLTLYDQDPEAAKAHLLEADSLVDTVRVELTNLIRELRPYSRNGHDLAETLNEYALEWAHRSGIAVDVSVQGAGNLSPDMEGALYRILQEALANVARHSAAEKVAVELRHDMDTVTLTVQDDGRGFNARIGQKGMGLHSMRERADSLGGTFELESKPGAGTRIMVLLPLNQ